MIDCSCCKPVDSEASAQIQGQTYLPKRNIKKVFGYFLLADV